ncbi:unnamed protein product [Phaedon cochleariae]|uniref:Uncharacterized protein n=1 Tax=Phaedon cochleariae TaxID=80249 RepID=A0A9P0DGC2_PHACE|nr:unnamed protein product [Phaedon cochleariae]
MGDPNGPKIETIPQDARYHNCNATKWCFATFVDYHKCKRLLGDGNTSCNQLSKIYKVICPNEWIKRWEEQMEVGTFPVDLPPKENDCTQIKRR